MGVDIQTYRGRIGSFVPSRGIKLDVVVRFKKLDDETLCNISMVGVVVFIGMLLRIAGIESNPGPTGTEFSFRYQFLLIQVGTNILRKLFDHLVCGDFSRYLNDPKNAAAAKQLGFLKLSGKLTGPQLNLIPPKDPKSSSNNFDITLLCCLLRNVCGLKNQSNKVWLSPAVTDRSVEANIARLRVCRNDLAHSGSVYDSKTDLDAKWKELCLILTEIGTYCGMAVDDIQSLISEAETVVIDSHLKDQFDDTISAWKEMDKSLDHRIDEVLSKSDQCIADHETLKAGQDDIKDSQEKLRKGQERLSDNLASVKEGQQKLSYNVESVKEHQEKLSDIVESVKEGQQKLTDNLKSVQEGQDKLRDNQENVKEIRGKLDDGQKRLEQTVTQGFEKINTRLDNVEEKHKEHDHGMKDEISQNLTAKYSEMFSELPVSPLLSYMIDMLKLFKLPTFFLIEKAESGSSEKETKIESCKGIFFKEGKPCRNIYLVGEAGVGKSSFSHFLCSIWYKTKLGLSVLKDEFSEFVDFMKDIDFVFYVSLRETTRVDIIAIIIDQYFRTDSIARWEKLYDHIDTILKQMSCLVILDGLDEWTPEIKGKEVIDIPSRAFYEKCIFLTTSRPYRTQNLKHHQDSLQFVKITGITGRSSTDYISDIVSYLNEKYRENKDPETFQTEVVEYGLEDLLCIPIIVSNLIIMWFQQKLICMSRTLIYSNIVDMQFEIAENKKVDLPSSTVVEIQLPDFLSGLIYFNKHVPLLQKVCLISFRSLFNQDKCEATLVFTKRQLMSKPYCIDHDEMNLLCKIGILSKTRMNRKVGIEEQKLTFLHLSYLEYFSAMYVALFDRGHTFNDDVVSKWTSLNDFLQFENLFLFLAGFSFPRVSQLFNMLYPLLLSDLTLIRRDAIFKYKRYFTNQNFNKIKSLQSVVLNCIKESRKSVNEINFIELEDFYFDDKSEIDILNSLLLFNSSCVKFLWSENGKYHDTFNQITNLTHLHVSKVVSGDFTKFIQCMLKNGSSLHTLSVKGNDTLIQLPPLRNIHPISTTIHQTTYLNHITSLSLYSISLAHESLHDLGKYLCDNVNMQNIRLQWVRCDECWYGDSQCTLNLDLTNHKQLYSLCLCNVDIICNKVNTSNLKIIELSPRRNIIARSYINMFHCINNSKLEHLSLKYRYDRNRIDNNTMRTLRILSSTLPTLKYIKVLELGNMRLSDDVPIQLHHDVSQVEIWLIDVKMSQKWFESFCDNLVNYKSVMKVALYGCNIASGVGDSDTEMSRSESVDMMYRYVNTPESKLKIIYKSAIGTLMFETTGCQQQ